MSEEFKNWFKGRHGISDEQMKLIPVQMTLQARWNLDKAYAELKNPEEILEDFENDLDSYEKAKSFSRFLNNISSRVIEKFAFEKDLKCETNRQFLMVAYIMFLSNAYDATKDYEDEFFPVDYAISPAVFDFLIMEPRLEESQTKIEKIQTAIEGLEAKIEDLQDRKILADEAYDFDLSSNLEAQVLSANNVLKQYLERLNNALDAHQQLRIDLERERAQEVIKKNDQKLKMLIDRQNVLLKDYLQVQEQIRDLIEEETKDLAIGYGPMVGRDNLGRGLPKNIDFIEAKESDNFLHYSLQEFDMSLSEKFQDAKLPA